MNLFNVMSVASFCRECICSRSLSRGAFEDLIGKTADQERHPPHDSKSKRTVHIFALRLLLIRAVRILSARTAAQAQPSRIRQTARAPTCAGAGSPCCSGRSGRACCVRGPEGNGKLAAHGVRLFRRESTKKDILEVWKLEKIQFWVL